MKNILPNFLHSPSGNRPVIWRRIPIHAGGDRRSSKEREIDVITSSTSRNRVAKAAAGITLPGLGRDEELVGGVNIMRAEAEPRRRMPLRLPGTDQVRRRIADVAAELTGGSPDHYLSLLGTIEPVLATHDGDGAAWRLSAYWGSYAESDAIERAVESVRRAYPFVQE